MPTESTQALNTVLHLSALLATDLVRYEHESGLTGPRIQLLWALGQTGPSTQQTLSTALGVTPRNITGLVDGLVASGHVTREKHPTDRRATLVTPTRPGDQTIKDLQDSHEDLARQLFDRMSDQQVSAFVATLSEVIATLQELMEEAT
ncbi:MarR family winged helix-turn-helix transcriptional regulator [Aeromicrobium sp. UC242_57]|uniref:MarR family winged helix-turn-helix transcriptional regulator n=1 Tax=Aeromicrobium sp. UC242_57 TaxID=3374624 RepID=UPI0037A8625A